MKKLRMSRLHTKLGQVELNNAAVLQDRATESQYSRFMVQQKGFQQSAASRDKAP